MTDPASDQVSNPYRLSPRAWELGYGDHKMLTELHEMGCHEDGYEELLRQRADIFDRLASMSAAELRAFVDGMQSHAGEYFS